jgi:hypothetical protein
MSLWTQTFKQDVHISVSTETMEVNISVANNQIINIESMILAHEYGKPTNMTIREE